MTQPKRWQRMAIGLGLALATACALLVLPASARAATPVSAEEDEAARELLVMLDLPRPHYRPDGAYSGAYGDAAAQQARLRIAAALARQHGLELVSEWPMPIAGVHCFVMRLPPGDPRPAAQVVQAVSQEAGVAWAQAMHIYHALAAAEEPLYPAQPVGQQWHLADLHGLATGRGVRIAVIDSGIAAGHPDLAGQVQRNENFVDGRPLVGESHGTAVAGIIAARADNGRGIAGVAPQARLLGLRACWQAPSAETLCTSFSLARALVAAVQSDAQIINMSLAGPEDKLLAVLVDQALARGMLVVAALAPGPDNFPASRPGVLAVGAAAPIPPGAVLAPGRDVPSTAPGGGWSLVSGSSFSAAHVSGLLALMRELDLGAQRGTIRTALVTEPAGRIDACATLLQQTHTRRTACAQTALGHTSD